jgi:endonuclease III
VLCESALNEKSESERLDYWQDYHAQLVMVGKHFCRTRAPRCEKCPLKSLLPRKSEGRSQRTDDGG